jgi:hypothetical protein
VERVTEKRKKGFKRMKQGKCTNSRKRNETKRYIDKLKRYINGELGKVRTKHGEYDMVKVERSKNIYSKFELEI